MLTVSVPTYNGERYVGEAIDSLLAQSYADFELIVVDDGSVDGTRAIAESYAERDARVRLVAQENGGLSRALNRGIEESRCEWVAFLDHDDIALPERLEKQVAASEANPDVVAWGTYARAINTQGKRLGYSPLGPTSREAFAELRARGLPPVLAPSMFLHRATVLAVGGFDSRFDGNQDTELLDRMAEVGPVLAIPEPLVLLRIHGGNTSRAMLMHLRERADYIRVRSGARVSGETPPTLEAFPTQNESPLAPILSDRRSSPCGEAVPPGGTLRRRGRCAQPWLHHPADLEPAAFGRRPSSVEGQVTRALRRRSPSTTRAAAGSRTA